MTYYNIVDQNDIKHKIKPKKIEEFSVRPEWWTCRIYKLLLWSLDKTEVMNLCIKKTHKSILQNLKPWKSVEHQMNVFKRLKENNIETYSDIRIGAKEQILITPFIWDEKNVFCISWNNKSHAKDYIINDLNWLHHRDISNLNTFIDTAKDFIDKLSKANIKVFDDSFFYKYDCNGGKLDIFIWDFHDIILDEEYSNPESSFIWTKQHNKQQFEKSLLFLHDDKVIDKALYDTFYYQLRDLNDY